jgi:hypothetical protein
MLRFRHGKASRPRVVLFGTVVLFLAVQLVLGAFVTHVHPEVRDPEYGSLLNSLEARLAQWPGRPLVLILGSSRCANAFRPSPPGPGSEASPDPIVFNFATLYTGPLRQLQMLRRLLARGVRPSWVVAEFWPSFFAPGAIDDEQTYILTRDIQLPDRALVACHFANSQPAYAKMTEAVAVPAFHHRSQLLRCYSPFMDRCMPRLPGDWSPPELRAVEAFGWLPCPEPRPEPEQYRQYITRSLQLIRDTKFAGFRFSPTGDAALRELLNTCSQHGIRTTLVWLPEHSMLRDNYPLEVLARIHEYVAGLVREQQVQVIDTRDWVPDDEFIDLVHVLPPAAAPFTERFRHEVLRPLMEGRPLTPHLLSPAQGTRSGA